MALRYDDSVLVLALPLTQKCVMDVVNPLTS